MNHSICTVNGSNLAIAVRNIKVIGCTIQTVQSRAICNRYSCVNAVTGQIQVRIRSNIQSLITIRAKLNINNICMCQCIFNTVVALALKCIILLIVGICNIITEIQLAFDFCNTALSILLIEYISVFYTLC